MVVAKSNWSPSRSLLPLDTPLFSGDIWIHELIYRSLTFDLPIRSSSKAKSGKRPPSGRSGGQSPANNWLLAEGLHKEKVPVQGPHGAQKDAMDARDAIIK